MKKLLHLYTALSIIFMVNIVHAQNLPWLEVGSEWIYQHGVWSGPDHVQVTYGITEQTTFAGRECAKMERLSTNGLGCISLQDPYYFYVSNDSLYYANESDSTFRLIADFGASVGDSWEYHVITDLDNPVVVDTFLVTVNGVSILSVEGEGLRQLELGFEWLGSSFYEDQWIVPYSGFPAIITEVIGGNGFFAPFGQLGFCDYETNVTFQCFESPSFSYLNPEYPSCNYVVSVDENNRDTSLNIFPNPASEAIEIEVPEIWRHQTGTVQLNSSTGKVVYDESSVLTNLLHIPLGHLPRGMYFLSIQSGAERNVAKIVVE